MTAADCEAIRRRMTLAKDGPLSVRRELLYEDMPRLIEEVARLQGLLDRIVEKLLKAPRQKAYLEKAYAFDIVHAAAIDEVVEMVRGAIPPSPQEPDK